MKEQLNRRQKAVQEAQIRLQEARVQEEARLGLFLRLEQEYRERGRKEQRRLRWAQERLEEKETFLRKLEERKAQYGRENAANPEPVKVVIRLEAGFGTYENVTLLIEMGYEVYTKAFSHRVVEHLRRQVSADGVWIRVGANAKMVVWKDYQFKGCPYPVDVALERFHTGKTVKYGALIHFGDEDVTQDPVGWFRKYNGRQTIEAGIKESKRVFYLHRIKVRSEPAIYLQEWMVIFSANFIRWAVVWLDEHCPKEAESVDAGKMGIKRQVKVGAHTSAWVEQHPYGVLLRSSEQGVFAGKVLKIPIRGPTSSKQNCKSRWKSFLFKLFSMISPLIAQPLGLAV